MLSKTYSYISAMVENQYVYRHEASIRLKFHVHIHSYSCMINNISLVIIIGIATEKVSLYQISYYDCIELIIMTPEQILHKSNLRKVSVT